MTARRVALVIGGGRGIGAASGVLFARRGYDVILAARTRRELEATAERVREVGGDALAVVADICDDGSVESLVRAAGAFRDRIHVLVNSAGDAMLGTIEETSPADFDRMVQVNLVGAYRVIHRALPLLARDRGQVINVLSRAGRAPYPNALGYGAAKAALGYLTQALAAGLASSGVRVNGLSPGAVATDLRRKVFPDEDPRSLPTPESIAAAIVQMTDPAFDAMNGAIIDFPS